MPGLGCDLLAIEQQVVLREPLHEERFLVGDRMGAYRSSLRLIGWSNTITQSLVIIF